MVALLPSAVGVWNEPNLAGVLLSPIAAQLGVFIGPVQDILLPGHVDQTLAKYLFADVATSLCVVIQPPPSDLEVPLWLPSGLEWADSSPQRGSSLASQP